MDEADDYRGWDLWLEDGKVGAHIIHKWPEDAIKVVSDADAQARRVAPRVRHLRRQGEGRRASSLRRRQAPAVERRRRHAQGHDPDQGPRSRSAGGATRPGSRTPPIHDLRVYGQALSADEVEQLAGAAPGRRSRRKAGRQAGRRPRSRPLRLVARDQRRRVHASCAARSRRWSRSRPRSKARGTRRPRDEREARAADGVRPVPRRVRQAPRPGEGRHPRRPAADARRPAAEPPGPGPVAAPPRAPADRPGDGQPVLAGGLRHRPGPDGRRLRPDAASSPPTPSCSTGWPSSSATGAGT